MKIILAIFTVLIFVGLPMRNALAEEVINEILSKTVPITGMYYDPTPLPDFPGGLFRFTATFKNEDSSADQLASLAFRVRQLTNGNTLFNGDNGRHGRLTSKITAGGRFEWKPGDVLPAQNVASAPAIIQSNLPKGGMGNFEVVYRDGDDQLRHWFRNNDVTGFPWEPGNDDQPFGEDVKSAPAFIQSNLPKGGLGNFEVVYRDGNDQLRHWFRKNDVTGLPWESGNDDQPFGEDVKSAPALVQSSLPKGGLGNYEVVYRDSNEQLRHWFRRNDVDGFPWVEGNDGKAFGYDVKSAPELIQNRTNGNLEVVYRDSNNQLRHWFRDENSVWRPGNNGVPFADDVTSAPALIQSNLGSQGDNYEVVVRKSDNKLHHYFRQRSPNDQDVFEWKSGGTPFAENENSAPALIQSSLGAAGGNFEVVVQEEGKLSHYFRTKKGEVVLQPREEISTQFVIGLANKNPGQFRFFVDAVGIRVPEISNIVYLGEKDATSNPDDPKDNGFNIAVNKHTKGQEDDVTFIIKKGVHRKQSVLLEPDLVVSKKVSFIGEDGAVMSGAELLLDWYIEKGSSCGSTAYSPEKDRLIHPADKDNNDDNPNFCTSDTCKSREDLYLDDNVMVQLADGNDTKKNLDQWHFNEDRTKVDACFKVDKPSEFDSRVHKIEISRARAAFGGIDDDPEALSTKESRPNVSIKNLILEKYATPIQFGAIGYQRTGKDWVIENNEVRWNHSAGIAFGKATTVNGNYVHENQQIGIKTRFLNDEDSDENQRPPLDEAKITQNVIEGNGRSKLGYEVNNEGGGTKFAKTKDLLVRRNRVMNNDGPGLWTDINNCETKYICNWVENNSGSGIFHEISFSATIQDNVLKKNGYTDRRTEDFMASQIQISTSQEATVRDNWVETDREKGNGIVAASRERNQGARDYCTGIQYDRWYGWNNQVSENTIKINEPTSSGNDERYVGATGIYEEVVVPIFRVDAGRLPENEKTPYEDPIVDDSGNKWFRDRSNSGIDTGIVAHSIETVTWEGNNDPKVLELFEYMRWDERDANELEYAFGVPNGSYRVNLFFAESYFSSEGKRIFNVLLENEVKVGDLDIFAEAGGKNIVLMKSVSVEVSDGELNIRFEHGTQDNPSIAAIEVIPDPEKNPEGGFLDTNQFNKNTYSTKEGKHWFLHKASVDDGDKGRVDYLTFQSHGQEQDDAESPGDWSQEPVGCTEYSSVSHDVCLVTFNNESYVITQGDGSAITGTGVACGDNAQLSFEDTNGGKLLHGDTVFIKTAEKDGYWSVDGVELHTKYAYPGIPERFRVYRNSNGGAIVADYATIALQTHDGKWVVQVGETLRVASDEEVHKNPRLQRQFTIVRRW